MDIQNFYLGDEVYFMDNNKVDRARVLGISTICDRLNKDSVSGDIIVEGVSTSYQVFASGARQWLDKSRVFSSKEELLKSL